MFGSFIGFWVLRRAFVTISFGVLRFGGFDHALLRFFCLFFYAIGRDQLGGKISGWVGRWVAVQHDTDTLSNRNRSFS